MITLTNAATTLQTAKHYSTKRTFIPTLELTSIEESEFCTCKFQPIRPLKFLTDEIGTDLYKNDFFSLYHNILPTWTNKIFYSTDGWVTETEITTDFGFEFNGTIGFGYRFTAFDVWGQLGYCVFDACIRSYTSLGELVRETYAVSRRLNKYSDKYAHNTVRIETRKKGKLRHGNDYSDLSFNSETAILRYWDQQVRLNGSLKLTGMPVELTNVVLNNTAQTIEQVFDTADFEYDLTISLASSDQIMPVLLDDLFANTVFVTDYNLLNFDKNSVNLYRNLKLMRKEVSVQTPPKSQMKKNFVFKMSRQESNIEKFND